MKFFFSISIKIHNSRSIDNNPGIQDIGRPKWLLWNFTGIVCDSQMLSKLANNPVRESSIKDINPIALHLEPLASPNLNKSIFSFSPINNGQQRCHNQIFDGIAKYTIHFSSDRGEWRRKICVGMCLVFFGRIMGFDNVHTSIIFFFGGEHGIVKLWSEARAPDNACWRWSVRALSNLAWKTFYGEKNWFNKDKLEIIDLSLHQRNRLSIFYIGFVVFLSQSFNVW